MKLKEKKGKNKWQFSILILLIITGICFGVWNSLVEKNELKNSKTAIGTIIEIEERFQRGIFIKYEFKVNEKKYTENQKLTVKKETIKNGDKFKVNYSEKKPEHNEHIFEKRIAEHK